MQRMVMTLGVLAAVCAASAPVMASEVLAKSRNCLACHKIDAKLVGPAYKEVAARYSVSDVGRLVESIQKGSRGNWGAVPMPSNKGISEEDARKLATWILGMK